MNRIAYWSSAPLVMLPRYVKRTIAISIDASLAVLTVWLAFYLRLGVWTSLSEQGWQAAAASVVIALPIFIAFGLYRAVFRYVGSEALLAVAQAIFVYGLVYAAIFTAWRVDGVPRTVGIIQPILLLVAVGASRIFGRYWLGGVRRLHRQEGTNRVLIYGAGHTGQQLADALSQTPDNIAVGFVDDSKSLHGSFIGDLRVWSPDKLADLIGPLKVHEVLLAIPSASRRRRNEVLELAQSAGVSVRTVPGLADLAAGNVTVNDIRPLEIEDLLGRDPIPPDDTLLSDCVAGETVLVTGAGGSIGSELCRQLLSFGPTTLVLLDSSEYNLFAIHRELTMQNEVAGGSTMIVPILASVTNRTRMRAVFSVWKPDIVYHAAAYKHVELVEQNIVEGVRNNVLGTQIVALLAKRHDCARFVLVSSDKAVRPTSVMGTTKRLAEMVLQNLAARQSRTCFTMVRFGNVLGSSGSVVPLFRQQISAGGPVTVTDRNVIRYFMTIPEAARLVLQAGAMAQGGEVFVLDMGEPVRIYDLAVRMIELSGLRAKRDGFDDGDIEIVITGLKPGEKLYEELLIADNPAPTAHPRIMQATEAFLPSEDLQEGISELREAIKRQDASSIRGKLEHLVPEYRPEHPVSDWTSEQAISSSSRNGSEQLAVAPSPIRSVGGAKPAAMLTDSVSDMPQ